MRTFTADLLRRQHHCWVAAQPAADELLADSLARVQPDLLVIDAGDFPACCRAALAEFPRDQVVVIGPEPDRAYETAAFRHGAGAWIARERVAEELGPAMRAMLGCHHDPCPPDEAGHDHRMESRPGDRVPTGSAVDEHGRPSPIEVVLIQSHACHLCDDAARVLAQAAGEHDLHLRRVQMTSPEGRALVRRHRAAMPPIVIINGELLGCGRLSRNKLQRRLAELTASHTLTADASTSTKEWAATSASPRP